MKKIKKYLSHISITPKLLGLIIIVTLIMGIGYANITGIDLSLSGVASASGQTGVVISNVTYLSNNNADVSNSNINTYYKSMVDSTITLRDDQNSSITYQVSIINLTNSAKEFKGVVYDSNFYDNEDIDFEVTGISIGDTIDPNETVVANLTFKYKEQQQHYDERVLNSYLNFKFDGQAIEEYEISSICEFNGENNDIVGDCANGQHIDYINTGISLFSAENHDNDFEIGFTVYNIDPSRFRTGKVDTIFDSINDTSPYPGVVFRIEDGKWYLQVGTGVNNKKLKWNPEDIQSFVLKKISNKVFYSINGGSNVYVADLTTIPTFDNPLTIGTALSPAGVPNPDRFLIGDLANLYVRVTEPTGIPYDIIDQEIAGFMNETMTVAYSSSGAHVFDGTSANIIDTGVELLNSTNYQKSFVVTFTIDEFTSSNQVNQATLFNIKDESNSTYPGLMLRLSGNRYEMTMKDGTGTVAQVYLPLTIHRINIIKKGMEFYYQVDFDSITPLSDTNNFSNYPVSNTFNIPATFGCNIDSNGNYGRMIKGTLSDMKIQVSASTP